MSKKLSIRDLSLIKLRTEKHLERDNVHYKDLMAATNSAIQSLKELSELKEKLFNIEQAESEENRIINIIDAKLEAAMISNDKVDFLEIDKSINNEVWSIIIQKKFGRTPQQLLNQSELRRIKAAQKIVNLHSELTKLNKAVFDLRKDVIILTAMKAESPEDLLKSREHLERLKILVESQIRKYNSIIYQKGIISLHRSFQDSLREAWDRASVSEARAKHAEAELAKLKLTTQRKKNPMSLIYGLRKRKEGKLINKSARRRFL